MKTLAHALLLSLPLAATLTTRAEAQTRWNGDYFPNVPLISHEGQTLHFFDDLIEGKVVMINFIYTSCPDSCPMETARMAQVCQLLGDRMGQDVFMYSISIDPEVDTPEVMNQYSKRFDVGPGWLFLTGKEADITLLRQKLGLYLAEIQGEDSKDHNLSLMIGNQATGRWMKRSPFESPYILAEQVGSWLSNWKMPRKGDHDYANAPKLRTMTKGEELFRTRCAACHLIGPGDGLVRPGPNLLGVTETRDPLWLRRWIVEPDKMLAEKDPLAMQLHEAYRGVPMPNMRVNRVELDALIGYLESESARVLAEQALAEQGSPLLAEAEEGGRAPCCEKGEALTRHADEDAGAAEASSSEEWADVDSSSPEDWMDWDLAEPATAPAASESAARESATVPVASATVPVASATVPAPSARVEAREAAPRGAQRRLSTAALVSIGLGVGLGLVTAFLSRRRSPRA